jgi:hypothetical protein
VVIHVNGIRVVKPFTEVCTLPSPIVTMRHMCLPHSHFALWPRESRKWSTN